MPTEQPGVYASLWSGGGVRLWTLVNREKKSVTGALLKVQAKAGDRYFDLIAGHETAGTTDGGTVVLSGTIRPRGIGCFVAGPAKDPAVDFGQFLQGQAAIGRPRDFDTATPRFANAARLAAAARGARACRRAWSRCPPRSSK